MARMVNCVVLKCPAEGLDEPPHPGPLGMRIYEQVSREGWRRWLDRLATIINENRLSTADPGTVDMIEQHMTGFLFGEGEFGAAPPGFAPQRKK
ncbi:MAG: oxidative damage protection protein [Acidiferrobacteraceae bacterium]